MALRKVTQNNLIIAALAVVLFTALTVEHGILSGSKAMAGLVYAASLMMLGFPAWVSLANRQLHFTRTHWYLAGYAATYAVLSLILSWPSLGLLTALGVMIPLVVCTVTSLFTRFGWW